MKAPIISIEDLNQLDQLTNNFAFFGRKQEGKIKLNLDKIPHHKKMEWEEQLTAYYYECGCSQGAIAMILGMIMVLVWHKYHFEGFTFSILTIFEYMMFIVSVSFLGKWSMLLWIKIKIKKMIQRIRAEYQSFT